MLCWRHPHCSYPKEGKANPTVNESKENKNVMRELINLEHKGQQNLELDVRGWELQIKGKEF